MHGVAQDPFPACLLEFPSHFIRESARACEREQIKLKLGTPRENEAGSHTKYDFVRVIRVANVNEYSWGL